MTVLAVARPPTTPCRRASATSSWQPRSGLDRDSVVNVSQIVTIDKSALPDWAGTVGPATMRQIEAGITLALDLPATG